MREIKSIKLTDIVVDMGRCKKTPAYTAKLIINGKLFALTHNKGDGFPDRVTPMNYTKINTTVFFDELSAIDEIIKKRTPKLNDEPVSLEKFCHFLVYKEMDRISREGWIMEEITDDWINEWRAQ